MQNSFTLVFKPCEVCSCLIIVMLLGYMAMDCAILLLYSKSGSELEGATEGVGDKIFPNLTETSSWHNYRQGNYILKSDELSV